MPRFYLPHFTASENTFTLCDPKEIHHLKNVLRLKTGDKVTLFNGKGQEARALIASIGIFEVTLHVEKTIHEDTEKTTVVLACAIPKKSKFELIIEKCTELGISEIVPMKTRRTEFKLSADNVRKKILRYERVAINAAKQCNRTTVPRIHPVTQFPDVFDLIGRGAFALIPCLLGERKNLLRVIAALPPATKKIAVFIGPEGDFSEDEVRLAIQNGAIPVSLGPTTLKVDTAAFSVIAALNFHFHADK